MAKSIHRQRLDNVENTGFSPNSAIEGGRLINRDGNVNIKKTGIPTFDRLSLYHVLLRMPRWKFLLLVFGFYFALNILFATAFYFIGIDGLDGATLQETQMNQFLTAFFFSAQTLTTVGYGHISPVGITANTLASFESMVGILAFALVTGVFYGRFSRPKAYIRFSDQFLIAPYRGTTALMFRLATFKNNHLTNVDANVSLAMHVLEEGVLKTKFYTLKLEISKVVSLALSWTLVHPINEESPLYGFTEQDFKDNRVEVMVNIKAFDDHFSNTVQQRSSYTFQELVFGAKFLPMSSLDPSGQFTLLELDKLSAHEQTVLPTANAIR